MMIERIIGKQRNRRKKMKRRILQQVLKVQNRNVMKNKSQKVSIALKEKVRGVVKCLFGNHLLAKQDFDGEKQKAIFMRIQIQLNRQIEIAFRKIKMYKIKIKKIKKNMMKKKQLERELPADKFRRQHINNLLNLKIKKQKGTFIFDLKIYKESFPTIVLNQYKFYNKNLIKYVEQEMMYLSIKKLMLF